jgi:MoaA/NifB/PqqE/SkfB family radical SAM enzyme
MSVQGKNYTSNVTKLLKHLPKLHELQNGKVSPVMVHIAITNVCNLHCTYCCYGNRALKDKLSLDQIKSALRQFRDLGTCGVEFTGGGDPTMHKELNAAVEFAKSLNYDIGLITNAVDFRYFNRFDLLDWIRVSLHAFNVDIKLDDSIKRIREVAPTLDISSIYIWTHGSEKVFDDMVAFTERHQIPTRITPDLTLGTAEIERMMPLVGERMKNSGGNYVFLSDFNVKTERAHHRCYMHMVKPFVYSDGNVYVCPSAALSPDNHLNVNERFKVCTIDTIAATYAKGVTTRQHDCAFCKYAPQNEFVDEVLTPTKHNSFA